uniref:Uncharacterized protein n=1 Tax=Globisporangium ultimum (strain ATCC 200006 / CBS 805.95 / DAOM BR144) TaxID=431595 RepID=K3WYV4_GLOUD
MILNGLSLIAIEDTSVIVMMKLLHVRFRTVHVYDVDGHKLKQTTRVVYPDTISWSDLLHLNASILS